MSAHDVVGFSTAYLESKRYRPRSLVLARGTVTEVKGRMAIVEWNQADVPRVVHVNALRSVLSVGGQP